MTKKTDEYQTTRIWKTTLHRLKLIAALKQSSIVEVIDTLSKQELERVQKGEGDATQKL
ncbi:MAG: hypothetical protein NVSMB49_28690 [Ktedonobacteraceae bacterium]